MPVRQTFKQLLAVRVPLFRCHTSLCWAHCSNGDCLLCFKLVLYTYNIQTHLQYIAFGLLFASVVDRWVAGLSGCVFGRVLGVLTGSGLLLLVSGHQHHHEAYLHSQSRHSSDEQSRYKLTLIKHEPKRILINLSCTCRCPFPRQRSTVIHWPSHSWYFRKSKKRRVGRDSQINTLQCCNYNEYLAE